MGLEWMCVIGYRGCTPAYALVAPNGAFPHPTRTGEKREKREVAGQLSI